MSQIEPWFLHTCGARRGDDRYVIEMAPAWGPAAAQPGVVCDGPVGARWLGRSRLFRYAVRCSLDGHIPDVSEAVESPRRVSDDPGRAALLLNLLPTVPSLTWGRDEIGSGDMWNSNSLVAWLLAGTGHDMTTIQPPRDGRAPGWSAGLVLASRLTPSRTPVPDEAGSIGSRGRAGH